MKRILLKAGLFICLLFLGGSYEEVFAESTGSAQCAAYGEIKQNQNPSFQHVNCLLTTAALEANIPPEVVKAVATQESGWSQFDDKGGPIISEDGGIGIMQITNQPSYDQERLKYDIYYNIQAGVEILNSMYRRTFPDIARDIALPKIVGAGPEVIENWYFPIMAYNGTKPVNSPLYKSNGKKNTSAYQEKVFSHIENDSFLKGTTLGQYPFKTSHFEYDSNSDKNIVFKKLNYILTDQMHTSVHLFQPGDKVWVTGDNVNLRAQPTKPSDETEELPKLPKHTVLMIEDGFVYDQTINRQNQFVWYRVKTIDQNLVGYISSAYIAKYLDKPVVNPINDHDISLSGKALAGARVQITKGTKIIGRAVANKNGTFKAEIAVQKAGTQLTVNFKDALNALSPSTTVQVLDKTAPLAPKVNAVTDKSTVVTGTAEAGTNVYVKAGIKTIGKGKTDTAGKFSVTVPVQKAGTKVSVVVRDAGGNISPSTTVTVQGKAAPPAPKVNALTDKDTMVIGTAEAGTDVYVKAGIKTIGKGKTDTAGKFSVPVPVQKAGTKVGVFVKDREGNISSSTTVIVQDKTAPLAPKVNAVMDKNTVVTGTAEAGTDVYVKAGIRTIGKGKADAAGKFSVTVPAQKAGAKVSVFVRDGGGNTSPSTVKIVSK